MRRLTGHLLLAAVLVTVCCAERQALPGSQRFDDNRLANVDGERTIVRRHDERRQQTVPAQTGVAIATPTHVRIAPPRPMPTASPVVRFALGFDELPLPPPTA